MWPHSELSQHEPGEGAPQPAQPCHRGRGGSLLETPALPGCCAVLAVVLGGRIPCSWGPRSRCWWTWSWASRLHRVSWALACPTRTPSGTTCHAWGEPEPGCPDWSACPPVQALDTCLSATEGRSKPASVQGLPYDWATRTLARPPSPLADRGKQASWCPAERAWGLQPVWRDWRLFCSA